MTQSPFDAYWHFAFGITPDVLAKLRRRQKLVLAIRGKQSLLQWDDVDVNEIAEWADEMVDLLKDRKGADDLIDQLE